MIDGNQNRSQVRRIKLYRVYFWYKIDFQKAVHILSEENNLTKDLILENLRRSHEGNLKKIRIRKIFERNFVKLKS